MFCSTERRTFGALSSDDAADNPYTCMARELDQRSDQSQMVMALMCPVTIQLVATSPPLSLEIRQYVSPHYNNGCGWSSPMRHTALAEFSSHAHAAGHIYGVSQGEGLPRALVPTTICLD